MVVSLYFGPFEKATCFKWLQHGDLLRREPCFPYQIPPKIPTSQPPFASSRTSASARCSKTAASEAKPGMPPRDSVATPPKNMTASRRRIWGTAEKRCCIRCYPIFGVVTSPSVPLIGRLFLSRRPHGFPLHKPQTKGAPSSSRLDMREPKKWPRWSPQNPSVEESVACRGSLVGVPC